MPRDALFSANLAAMASREIFTFDGRRPSGMGTMSPFGDRVGDRVDPFLLLVQLGLRKRKTMTMAML